MLGSRGPAENSPEVVQAQLAAFSHALVSTKGEVQTVNKSLAHLTQKLEQEAQLRQQLEVRFEDFIRVNDWNTQSDELATVVGDIKAWRKGFEDELKLKHEQLANAQQESAAELQQRFDALRCSAGGAGSISQRAGASMDLEAMTKRFEKLELHCKGLDKLVCQGPDIKEPSSKGSGVSTFVTDLAHRCDKMSESIGKLLEEVPELNDRSLQHTVSIEQLAGQRLELMDGLASIGVEMQEERTLHGGAMKAMEEIMRFSEEQRGGDMMKAGEDIVRLTALVMEMDKELGSIKLSNTSLAEQLDKRNIQSQEFSFSQGKSELELPPVEQKIQRIEQKLQRNVTWECNESHFASKDSIQFKSSSEYIVDQGLGKSKGLEDSLVTSDAGLKALDDSRGIELLDLLSVVTERTSGLEEQSRRFRTDMADIFGILEALDSSQLNRVQGQLENFSKELQLEKKERESETELLRSIVQSLEGQVARAATQAPRPGPRRGGETQRGHLGLSARQPDPARDNLARSAPSAEQMAGFRSDLRQRSPDSSRVAPSAEQMAGFRTDLRQRSPDSSRAANRIQLTRDVSPPKMSSIMRRDPFHSGSAPTVSVQCSQGMSPAAAASFRPSPGASNAHQYSRSPSPLAVPLLLQPQLPQSLCTSTPRILSRSPSPPAVNQRVLLSCTSCEVTGHASPPDSVGKTVSSTTV